jgi:hypothetical protein
LNNLYNPKIQEKLNNKFYGVISLFNEEIESCYQKGIKKLKIFMEEKQEKINEVNQKYESDIYRLETQIDYSINK